MLHLPDVSMAGNTTIPLSTQLTDLLQDSQASMDLWLAVADCVVERMEGAGRGEVEWGVLVQ